MRLASLELEDGHSAITRPAVERLGKDLDLEPTGLGPEDQAHQVQVVKVAGEQVIPEEETMEASLEGDINRVITGETSLVDPHQEISIQGINIGLIMTRHRRLLLVLIRIITLIPPLGPLAPNREVLEVNHKLRKIGRRLGRRRGGRRSCDGRWRSSNGNGKRNLERKKGSASERRWKRSCGSAESN